MKKWIRSNAFPEAYIWLGALIFLALTTPGEGHWTLCPLANAGFEACPGCGLGTAVSHILHGQLAASWQAHPLGIPALLLLTARIIHLFKTPITATYGKSN